jgi:hypothetical protein
MVQIAKDLQELGVTMMFCIRGLEPALEPQVCWQSWMDAHLKYPEVSTF